MQFALVTNLWIISFSQFQFWLVTFHLHTLLFVKRQYLCHNHILLITYFAPPNHYQEQLFSDGHLRIKHFFYRFASRDLFTFFANRKQLFRSEGCPTNTVAFDKQDFIDKIICGLSIKIEKELNNYLDKHLQK